MQGQEDPVQRPTPSQPRLSMSHMLITSCPAITIPGLYHQIPLLHRNRRLKDCQTAELWRTSSSDASEWHYTEQMKLRQLLWMWDCCLEGGVGIRRQMYRPKCRVLCITLQRDTLVHDVLLVCEHTTLVTGPGPAERGGTVLWVRADYVSHCSQLRLSAPVASTPLPC